MSQFRTDAVPQRVFGWLLRLHALTAGGSGGPEATERVGLVAPMIANRYPLDAFTQRSLEHVASKCRFWPSYGELATALGEWWNANRTAFPALLPPPPEPDRQPPTEADLAAVAELVRQFRGGLAEGARERDRLFPEAIVAIRPLADVTLKGDALRRSRQSRGCNVPVAP